MNGSALVDRYLADLASTAATLPSARRAELLDEVREHIATALEAAAPDDEVAVRNVLERLGTPAEIVAAEWVAEDGTPTTGLPRATAPLPPAPTVVPPPASGPPPAPAPVTATQPAPGYPCSVAALLVVVFGAFALTTVSSLVIGARFLFWMAPAVVVVLLYEVYKARQRANSTAPAPLAPRTRAVTPGTVGLIGILVLVIGLLAFGHHTGALIIGVTFVPVLVITLILATSAGTRNRGVSLMGVTIAAILIVLALFALMVVFLLPATTVVLG